MVLMKKLKKMEKINKKIVALAGTLLLGVAGWLVTSVYAIQELQKRIEILENK